MITHAISSETEKQILEQLYAAQKASYVLGTVSTEERNTALAAMATTLLDQQQDILTANQLDIVRASANGAKQSFIDRLTLTPQRLEAIAASLQEIIVLPDPVGEIQESWRLSNGLLIERLCVPFGVIAMIYEARPNVTVDAAALTIKTGNAVVLRGSADALASNRAITGALRAGLQGVGLPANAIQFIDAVEHEAVDYLLRQKQVIDLVIPRGGESLIRTVVERSLVPVIETGIGNCHIYVEREANLKMAEAILLNAKVQRPSVCNSVETLLVHQDIAQNWLPQIIATLRAQQVEVRGCERSQSIQADVCLAQESGWETEFLDLVLAVKVVSDTQEAIEHIARYSTHHTECIVTENEQMARQFIAQVDSAAVFHNASPRLTDGFIFGFGAEIGISTQKLHARGPMGLKALTTYKYIGHGSGQIRG